MVIISINEQRFIENLLEMNCAGARDTLSNNRLQRSHGEHQQESRLPREGMF